MRQMGRRSGSARHSCVAAEELQQTDRKCVMNAQLSLTTLTDTSARRKLHRQTIVCSTGWSRTRAAIHSSHAMEQRARVTAPYRDTAKRKFSSPFWWDIEASC